MKREMMQDRGRRMAGTMLIAALLVAGARGNGDYAVAPQTIDGGGGRSTSANYTVDAGIGSLAGPVAAVASTGVARHGYVGQLSDPVGFALSAAPLTVDEEDTRQLHAAVVNDDDTQTLLDGTEVAWSVVEGPIDSVDATGLATAAAVYEDTPAVVRGQWGAEDETLALTVLDVLPDNYGLYAADGIYDQWQITYYGLDNPDAAPGFNPFGTGDNLFKFIANLDPTNPDARFHFAIQGVPGEPDQRDLIFSPLAAGRVYTLLARTDLTVGEWVELDSAGEPVIEGDQATVTDLDAADAVKFYQVRIAWPR